MATVSPPKPATARAPRRVPVDLVGRSRRALPAPLRRGLPAAATILAVAIAARAFLDPWFMNYDARYALVWARDVWHGSTPDFLAAFAPTPHPLSTAIGSLALPFGHSGDQVVVWLVMLGFGALVWLSYELGARLFNPWVGVVTALVVATRPMILRDVLLDYQDVWFEALVVGAAVLEAGRCRRGPAVLVLLALAGLLRPEAWVLSGLYWLYLWRDATPRQRAAYAALVASAPLLWALADLIVTGDALHSLHGTADLAEENDRRRGIGEVPKWTLQYFAYTLRWPLAVGIPIGLAFAWRRRLRQAWLPLTVAAAMTAVFALGPLFGLPLIDRYIRTPAILIAVFYGLAVAGWLALRPGTRERRVWIGLAGLALLASVLWLPSQARNFRYLERSSERMGALYADLRAAGEDPRVRAVVATCGPLTATDHRPIPYIRWWLDGAPGSVTTTEDNASPRGKLLLTPRRTAPPRRLYGGNLSWAAQPRPAGWRTLYSNRSWRVYAAPACR